MSEVRALHDAVRRGDTAEIRRLLDATRANSVSVTAARHAIE